MMNRPFIKFSSIPAGISILRAFKVIILPALLLTLVSSMGWFIIHRAVIIKEHYVSFFLFTFVLFMVTAIVLFLLIINVTTRLVQSRFQENYYQAILNRLPDVYFEMNIDGQLLEMNPAGLALLNISRKELPDHTFQSLLADPSRFGPFISALYGAEKLENYPLELNIGKLRQTLVNVRLERGMGGSPEKVYGSIRDISDMSKMDQQQLEAVRLDAIAAFTTNFSREMQAYNSLIHERTLALEQSEPGLETAGNIREIQAETEKMSVVLHHLRTFGQQQNITPVMTDLNDLITNLSGLLSHDRDLALELDLLPDLPSVYADPGQLEQVIFCLTDNARLALKAGCKSGKPVIVVRTGLRTLDESFVRGHARDRVPAGDYVMLSISDNGAGMDTATREQIFEPFFSTTPYATGLGLSIVYGIVRQNHGFINVYSEAGHGTAFHIYWPVNEVKPVKPVLAPTGRDTEQGVILLVDDNKEFLEYMSTVLTTMGYQVHECENAPQALEEYAKGVRPDLVIADYIMPGMNGIEMIEELLKKGYNAPVIVTSGFVQQQVLGGEKPDISTEFLQKPFTLHELLAKVKQVMEPIGPRS